MWSACGSARMLFAVALLATSPTAAFALPKANQPIDPEKRAPISTRDAVRPGAAILQGDGVIGGGMLRTSQIPLRPAAVSGERAAVEVTEARDKRMIRPEVQPVDVRARERDRRRAASDLPASIPRLSDSQFRGIVTAYQQGRMPARDMLVAEVGAGNREVSIGDINRYANPARALEAQGIPVRRAGASAASEAAPADVVPIARDKR
ncbi:hypothetical protein [Congregicoccus parvus]|uniref:hypothetical protein n=1 Tax=Congregicoccus parvus TaxID=3081749 RepID=UPI003FA5692C